MKDLSIRFLMLLLPVFFAGGVWGSWYMSIGFDASDATWWRWLFLGLKRTGTLPEALSFPIYIFGGVSVITFLGLLLWQNSLSSRTLLGGRGTSDLHGSARWASLTDVKKAGLTPQKGVVVGGFRKGRKMRTLKHDGAEHILAFAPTRSGKGVGLVLPTLLGDWTDSVLVFDIKGENYALTSGYRQSIGNRVLKFEPTSEEGSVKFNPLEEVRLETPMAVSDCQNIAMMIIDPNGQGLKDYFMQAGYSWLTCAILHCCVKAKQEGGCASLRDVAIYMREFGDEDDFNEKLEDMRDYEHGRADIDMNVRALAGEMRSKADKERSGVHGTAVQELSLYLDPIVGENISKSDFTVDDMMNSERPLSLYMILPPSNLDRIKPLFRIMMNIFLRRLTEKMEFKDGRSVKHYKHRLLLLMDEFTSIGKLEIFEKALAFMSGYGIKCYIIIQDMTQLEQAYGKEQSIVSNCHIRIAYAPNKIETAKTLSEMCGETTIVQKKRSRSGLLLKANISDSITETKRSLLTPAECMSLRGMEKVGEKVLGGGDMLILPAGFPPIYGEQVLYFQDEELLKRAKIPASVGFELTAKESMNDESVDGR